MDKLYNDDNAYMDMVFKDRHHAVYSYILITSLPRDISTVSGIKFNNG